MSPSEPPFHLWIAADDARVVAALAPLKVSRSPLKHEWGSITDLRAVPAGPESSKVPGVIVLCTVVLLASAGLCFTGAPLLVIAILMALLLALGLAGILTKKPPAQVVAPDQAAFPDLHRTLTRGEEREDFLDMVELAERAGRALPAVSGVIDPVEGGELLAQVLWEAADVLSRRQQLRTQMRRQQHQPTATASSSTPVAQALADQRERVTTLWDQTEAELSRIRTALELAAVAAENAAHDVDARDAVGEAYRELVAIYGERF